MSMDTLELLRRLYVAGVMVGLSPEGTIRLSGHQPPADLMAELKAHRADVLATLRAQGLGTNADGYPSPLPRRYAVPAGCLAHRTCARLGPCSHFLTRRACNPAARPRPEKEAA
jgi:hypothetical protein